MIVESFDIMNDSVTFFKLLLFGLKMSKLIFEKFCLFHQWILNPEKTFGMCVTWQNCQWTDGKEFRKNWLKSRSLISWKIALVPFLFPESDLKKKQLFLGWYLIADKYCLK